MKTMAWVLMVVLAMLAAGSAWAQDDAAAPAAGGDEFSEGAPAEGDEFAEGEGGEGEGGTGQERRKPGMTQYLLPILLIGVLWFVMMRGPKKRQQQRQQALSAMEKHDKVRTIGGIIGTIVEFRGEEVILKVDESSNTRMRFMRSALAEKYTEKEEEEKK